MNIIDPVSDIVGGELVTTGQPCFRYAVFRYGGHIHKTKSVAVKWEGNKPNAVYEYQCKRTSVNTRPVAVNELDSTRLCRGCFSG